MPAMSWPKKPRLARKESWGHISGMNEKARSFSQSSVRDASRGAPTKAADRATGRDVVVPAKLDPRATADNLPKELGGVKGPEPTRFGDWEHNGRCTDF